MKDRPHRRLSLDSRLSWSVVYQPGPVLPQKDGAVGPVKVKRVLLQCLTERFMWPV